MQHTQRVLRLAARGIRRRRQHSSAPAVSLVASSPSPSQQGGSNALSCPGILVTTPTAENPAPQIPPSRETPSNASSRSPSPDPSDDGDGGAIQRVLGNLGRGDRVKFISSLTLRWNVGEKALRGFLYVINRLAAQGGQRQAPVTVSEVKTKARSILDEVERSVERYCSTCWRRIDGGENENCGDVNCVAYGKWTGANSSFRPSMKITLSFTDQLQQLLAKHENSLVYRGNVNAQLIDRNQDSHSFNTPLPGGNLRYVRLLLSGDSFAYHKSTNMNCWVYCMQVLNLPPAIRQLKENCILCGLFITPATHPPMDVFMREFSEECNGALHNGVLLPAGGQIPAKITEFTCDLKARQELVGVVNHQAAYACGICEDPGVLGVPGTTKRKYPVTAESNCPFAAKRARQRTDLTQEAIVRQVDRTGQSYGGQHHVTPLAKLLPQHCMLADYMHVLEEGLLKDILRTCAGRRQQGLVDQNFDLTPWRNEINEAIADIRLPTYGWGSLMSPFDDIAK